MHEKVFVIDDEESIRFTFAKFLEEVGYSVKTAQDFDEALALLAQNDFDLVISDIVLGGNTGIDILRAVRKKNMSCPVVLITGYPDVKTAAEAIRLGAFDYIYKPVEKDKVLQVAKLALQHKALIDENDLYRRNLEAIFRSVKDAIVTVDWSCMIVNANDAARKILGLNGAVTGKPFSSLPMSCREQCLQALEHTVKNKCFNELSRLECHVRDQQRIVVTVSTSPLLNCKGECQGAVMVLRDETRLVEFEHDQAERGRFHKIVGRSKKMQRIYSLIELASEVQSTVLITGESGTGKELVAEALHYCGARKDKPLVKVNLSTISDSLFESEIFGHVKGAFTGADCDRPGRFQLADGGTIFFDEIGDISHQVQLSLLRVLQEREFERVGDARPVAVDVRVVAATNQDLPDKIRRGKFREDLFFRLKIIEIALPPLRERKEDIPLLVDHFIEKFNRKFMKAVEAISDDVLDMFMNYSWRGNVRELEHTLEHAFLFCRQGIITVDNLPKDFTKTAEENDIRCDGDDTLSEHKLIIRALEQTDWNKAKTARLLGMGRRTLYRKLEKHNINDSMH